MSESFHKPISQYATQKIIDPANYTIQYIAAAVTVALCVTPALLYHTVAAAISVALCATRLYLPALLHHPVAAAVMVAAGYHNRSGNKKPCELPQAVRIQQNMQEAPLPYTKQLERLLRNIVGAPCCLPEDQITCAPETQ